MTSEQVMGMEPVGAVLQVCFAGKVCGYGEIMGKLFYQLETPECKFDIFPEQTAPALAKVEETVAGPHLWVNGVQVRSWLGNIHNPAAHDLAAEINAGRRPCGT